MQILTRISIAVVCALGVSAAIAQTVQPRSQGVTQVRPPLQTAQAPAAGGAAAGASTAAGATASGAVATTGVMFVGLGALAVVVTNGATDATVTHTP